MAYPRGNEKGKVAARGARDELSELGVHRDRQRGAGLLLSEPQDTATDMLRPHLDDITAPLSGVEQERHRQPRSRPDWVVSLELRDLFLSPGVNAALACF